MSTFDSSHHICNPSDPLPCLPAFSHVGSSILSAQLTVGHVVMRERQREEEREREDKGAQKRGVIAMEISTDA